MMSPSEAREDSRRPRSDDIDDGDDTAAMIIDTDHMTSAFTAVVYRIFTIPWGDDVHEATLGFSASSTLQHQEEWIDLDESFTDCAPTRYQHLAKQ